MFSGPDTIFGIFPFVFLCRYRLNILRRSNYPNFLVTGVGLKSLRLNILCGIKIIKLYCKFNNVGFPEVTYGFSRYNSYF